MVVVICGDVAGGRDVVLDGAALRGVTVVCRGENHGRLVGLRVLMVEVDHTPAAVRGSGHTAEEQEEEEEGQYER